MSIFEVTQKTLETVPDGDPIPVGYVQPYARVHLLHQETHEPVPDGEVGFLHIGGPGLAVGYIGNSVLTQVCDLALLFLCCLFPFFPCVLWLNGKFKGKVPNHSQTWAIV